LLAQLRSHSHASRRQPVVPDRQHDPDDYSVRHRTAFRQVGGASMSGSVVNPIRARGIRKSFGALEVLKGVDLDLAKGEVLCILGPSGSGKSTLLRCINHLEQPDRGMIELNGVPVGYRLSGTAFRELPEREIQKQRA